MVIQKVWNYYLYHSEQDSSRNKRPDLQLNFGFHMLISSPITQHLIQWFDGIWFQFKSLSAEVSQTSTGRLLYYCQVRQKYHITPIISNHSLDFISPKQEAVKSENRWTSPFSDKNGKLVKMIPHLVSCCLFSLSLFSLLSFFFAFNSFICSLGMSVQGSICLFYECLWVEL